MSSGFKSCIENQTLAINTYITKTFNDFTEKYNKKIKNPGFKSVFKIQLNNIENEMKLLIIDKINAFLLSNDQDWPIDRFKVQSINPAQLENDNDSYNDRQCLNENNSIILEYTFSIKEKLKDYGIIHDKN